MFGLEAARELEAVAAALPLLVDDPQIGGMGRGAFTSEGFLGGWNAGNLIGAPRAAVEPARGSTSRSRTTRFRSAVLERIWRWNHDRERLQGALGDVFVPRISFLQQDGRVQTFVVWGELPSRWPCPTSIS